MSNAAVKAVIACALLGLFGLGWFIGSAAANLEKSRLETAWARERATLAAARTRAVIALRNAENAHRQKLEKAVHEAATHHKALVATRRAMRVDRDRMRGERATMRLNLATASRTAAIAAVTACHDVFGQCTERYADVARDADKCVIENRTLREAWPSGPKEP